MGSRGRMTKPKRKRERLSSAPRPAHRPRSKQSGRFAKYMDASPLTTAELAEKLGLDDLKADSERVLKLNFPSSALMVRGFPEDNRSWYQFWR